MTEAVPPENWIVGTNARAIEAARKRLPEAHLLRLCADRQGTCVHGHDGVLRCVVCCLEIALGLKSTACLQRMTGSRSMLA